MPEIELSMEEVLYLEATLRAIKGTRCLPVGLDEEKDLCQGLLNKLEEVG